MNEIFKYRLLIRQQGNSDKVRYQDSEGLSGSSVPKQLRISRGRKQLLECTFTKKEVDRRKESYSIFRSHEVYFWHICFPKHILRCKSIYNLLHSVYHQCLIPPPMLWVLVLQESKVIYPYPGLPLLPYSYVSTVSFIQFCRKLPVSFSDSFFRFVFVFTKS